MKYYLVEKLTDNESSYTKLHKCNCMEDALVLMSNIYHNFMSASEKEAEEYHIPDGINRDMTWLSYDNRSAQITWNNTDSNFFKADDSLYGFDVLMLNICKLEN